MSTGLAAVVSAALVGAAVLAADLARRDARTRLDGLTGGVTGNRAGTGPRPPRRRRPLRATRDAGIDLPLLCGELAAVMRAGLSPVAAWQALAERDGPQGRLCRRVLAAADGTSGRVGTGLIDRSEAGPGWAAAVRVIAGETSISSGRRRAAPLQWFALGLAVSDRTGAPVADVLERLTVALRAEAVAEADRAAVMAGPRATAAVLSLLPVAGLGLGTLIGADPARTLVSTSGGRGCLFVGLLLWGTGVWWARALVGRAARAGSRP